VIPDGEVGRGVVGQAQFYRPLFLTGAVTVVIDAVFPATKPFRAIVKRAGLSSEVSAYALRHSSITRCLCAGLPVELVASLHDTSSEMIRRYYAKFITHAFEAMAAKARVPLVGPEPE
jgi:site-specific recombinase XerD